MKIFIVLILSCLSVFDLKSQPTFYTINGQIKQVSSGIVYLVTGNLDSKYFGSNITKDSSRIINGQFLFHRKKLDNNIYAYRCFIKSATINGVTDLIFIAPVNQTIIIDTVDEHIAPIIPGSSIQLEMTSDYNGAFRNFLVEATQLSDYEDEIFSSSKEVPNEKVAALNKMRKRLSNKSDSLFLQYAIDHLHSYVTLWKLIERFSNLGFKKDYIEIYNLLSDEIKNSNTGKIFKGNLNAAKLLSINSPFPRLNLKNTFQKNILLDATTFKDQYTLIDFWFSTCAPCIREFQWYKVLFKKYRSQGFNIVGISVDRKTNSKAWKDVIDVEALPWDQYLDEDGVLSSKLAINSFPTNYLLNAKGEIIQKNISRFDLENILIEAEIKKTFDKIYLTEPE